MPRMTDTHARAYAACDLILIESGKFPTIEAVREHIGVNSPSTIKSAIAQWKQDFAEKHYQKLNQPDLPAILMNAVEQLWGLAVAQAEQAYAEKEQAFQRETLELNQALAGAQGETERNRAALDETLARLAEADEHGGTLQAALNQSHDAVKEKEEQIGRLEFQLHESLERQVAERQTWEIAQQQHQDWFYRRIEEEKSLAENRWRERVAQLQDKTRLLQEAEGALRNTALLTRKEAEALRLKVAELEAALIKKQKLDANVPFKKRLEKRAGSGV